jgi:hypothetical protein
VNISAGTPFLRKGVATVMFSINTVLGLGGLGGAFIALADAVRALAAAFLLAFRALAAGFLLAFLAVALPDLADFLPAFEGAFLDLEGAFLLGAINNSPSR